MIIDCYWIFEKKNIIWIDNVYDYDYFMFVLVRCYICNVLLCYFVFLNGIDNNDIIFCFLRGVNMLFLLFSNMNDIY